MSGVDLDKHSEGTPNDIFTIHFHRQIMSTPDTRGAGDVEDPHPLLRDISLH